MERKANGEKRKGESKREGRERRGGEERGKRKRMGRVASWLLGGMDAPGSKNGQNFAF